MTPEAQKNLDFLKSSFEKVGFGTIYHKELEDGIRAGKPTVPFTEVEHPVSQKETMSYVPTVSEKEDRPGFYIFTDFKATKSVEGAPDVSITVPHFKMTGMTVEQSRTVLNGGTVLHTEGEDGNKAAKYYFTAIDTSKPVKEGENAELIRIPAKNFDLARLLSKEEIIGKQEEKELTMNKIQNGLRPAVTFRQRENGVVQYPKGTLQLAIVKNKATGAYDMALNVYDPNGKLIRNHAQQQKEEKAIETGLRMKTAKKPEWITSSALQMAAGPAGGQQTSKSRTQTPR